MGTSHALPRLPCAQKTGQGNVSTSAGFIPPWRRRSWRGSRPSASESEERQHVQTSLRRQKETEPENHRDIILDGGRVIYTGSSLQICLTRVDQKSGCFHLAADPLRGGHAQ